MKVTDVSSTPLATATPSTAAAKKAESTSTTDTVSLSAEARAAAADGLPIFATADSSGTTDLGDVATKVKQEERAKRDRSVADKLETQFLDEQSRKMDAVDRLDTGGIREDAIKKERLVKVGDRAKDEASMKSVRIERVGDRAKSEEAKKQVRYETVTEKFAGTDQLESQLDRLDKVGLQEEQKKKAQSQRMEANWVRTNTKTGETLAGLATRAKEEELQKATKMDRLELRSKDEASRKAVKVQSLAEKGAISPTETKELTSLMTKNLEERAKAFGDDRAATGTTDTTVDPKVDMGGTATSMAAGIEYAADRASKVGMGGTATSMAAGIVYAADAGAKAAATDIGTKPADFTLKNITDKAV